MGDIKIYGKLVNVTTDNVIVGTDQTYDTALKKPQSEINAEFKNSLGDKMSVNPVTLTNQDLNSVLTPGFYNAAGDNTVTNKPAGIDAFGLFVYKVASGYVAQELVSGNLNSGAVYYRQYNNTTWTGWLPKAGVFSAKPILNQVLTSDESGRLKSSGFTIESNVPAGAKFTDTTYNPATTTTPGLMSNTDKTKLDGIQEGANKIIVGDNITNTNGTISLTGKNVTDALGFTPSGVTYGQVTESKDGLMIAADKKKLNGIEEGAQKNTVTSVAGRIGAVTLTKSDVGLANVDNTSDADKPVSKATQKAIDAILDSMMGSGSLSEAHMKNFENPHHVTKAQVELGNVDNTADKDKPISTLQKAALDKKVEKVVMSGSGNAVTEASISGDTLTLTKGATYNNYTHPAKHTWDILSNPPATATRWPDSMEITTPATGKINSSTIPSALVPYIPKAGTNMFAGATAPDEITVERSTNSGTSWTDVTTTVADSIRNIFSGVVDGSINVSTGDSGKGVVGHQLRITFNPKDRYCALSFIHIWGSTNGGRCTLDIEYNTRDNKTTWVKQVSDVELLGWSGPTIIGMGSSMFSQPNSGDSRWGLRFTFKQIGISEATHNSNQTIASIQGFSTSIAWSTPAGNPICKSGTPYTIENSQLTTNFPGTLKCKSQEVFHKGNLTWNNLPGKPTSLPASDVYPWAKAENKPTYTKSEISGLDKVDNTADKDKPISTLQQAALDKKVEKVAVNGTGNVITDASVSGGTIYLTKGNVSSYSLPLASETTRGGVKTGYTSSGRNYAVQLDSTEKMYVEVPWTDTNTTYTAGENLTLSGNSFALNKTISLTRVNASGGFYQTSDRRLKSDIKPLEHSLDDICSIPTDSFILSGKKDFGTIAQEVEDKFPELVTSAELKQSDVPNPENFETIEKDGETYVLVKEVDYAKMSILAIEGIKLLREEINELRNQLSNK